MTSTEIWERAEELLRRHNCHKYQEFCEHIRREYPDVESREVHLVALLAKDMASFPGQG